MNHGHSSKRMLIGTLLACALPVLIVTLVPALGRSPFVRIMVVLGGMVALHWLFMRPQRNDPAAKEHQKDLTEDHSTH